MSSSIRNVVAGLALLFVALMTGCGGGGGSTSPGTPGTGGTPSNGQLTVSPSSLTFGNVTVGSSASLAGSLSASGASVTVTSATLSPQYSLKGITFPVTVVPGTKVPFTVVFTPTAAGTPAGTITFQTNAANVLANLSVSGTGTIAVAHNVNLTWTPSTSTGITAYNVYRGTVSGGPYTLVNSVPGTSASYSDSTVKAGTLYFYVVTSVESSVESVVSTEMQALIPTP